MLNTYDFNVTAATLVEGFSHTRTYRINAQDRDRARQKMWNVVLTQTPRFEYGRIEWERCRGAYTHPQGMHDVEVRQALDIRGKSPHAGPCPAFIYAITDKIQVRHTGPRAKSDEYLTWDEFKAAWTTVPGYYI